MTTKNQHTADSRLPWRVVKAGGDSSCFEVWTRQDDTPGSRNNYMIAGGIQSEAEAIQLAASPELLEALQGILRHATKVNAHGHEHSVDLPAFNADQIKSLARTVKSEAADL